MGEFSEASFRIRRKDFSPKKPWAIEGAVPGAHLVMTVFGCLIYALNQCANTLNDANVMACANMIQVCESYASVKDDFQSCLKALPLDQVKLESEKLNRAIEAKSATQKTGQNCKGDVDKIKTPDDLCAIIVSLITNAIASGNDATASVKTSSLICALGDYDWSKLNSGKFACLECNMLKSA